MDGANADMTFTGLLHKSSFASFMVFMKVFNLFLFWRIKELTTNHSNWLHVVEVDCKAIPARFIKDFACISLIVDGLYPFCQVTSLLLIGLRKIVVVGCNECMAYIFRSSMQCLYLSHHKLSSSFSSRFITPLISKFFCFKMAFHWIPPPPGVLKINVHGIH